MIRCWLLCVVFSYLRFASCSCFAQDPEAQIVIMDDFLPVDIVQTLIKFYDSEKTELNQHTDNQLTFSSSTPPNIRHIVMAITEQILAFMEQVYHLPLNRYHVDHCGLYARIAGNSCTYHADNTYFDCPIHGRNQSILRQKCSGTCPGARFMPNHTYWREYTALLYLNDDFEGGEIVFEDGPFNRIYKKKIPIKANRLLIAPNGPHFYHEVLPVRKGKRYSLHIWYTSDAKHIYQKLSNTSRKK